MKIYPWFAMAAAVVLLPACESDPVGPQCGSVPFQQAAVSGDTIINSTGLRYINTSTGTGAEVEACQAVTVHYTGYLLDGTQFDSSRARNQPLGFIPGVAVPQLGRLIPGFEQGVIGMQVGGTRRIIVPPNLAYGAQAQTDGAGNVVIPANSTIVFDIELLAIEPRS